MKSASPKKTAGPIPITVGNAPDGVGCVLCQTADERPVFKIKDGRVGGGKAECLHEGCATAWFKGEFQR